MLSILFVGFLLGMRHALEADHVMAVATLAVRDRSLKRAINHGIAWGVGHTLTLFSVVAIVVQFSDGVPERLASFLEMIVGFMLVLLGADVLRRLFRDRVHFHLHQHEEENTVHFHAHSHKDEGQHIDSPHNHGHGMSWRALFVGLIHGLAGSAALVILTVASTDSFWLGMVYTLLFGIGSILGMTVLSTLVALPLGIWGQQLSKLYDGALVVIGISTMMLGGSLLLTNAITSGLLIV